MDKRLLVLALGMFALGTDSFVMAGILPQIARTFDVPIGGAAQMITVYAVTYAVAAPTLAALAARVPRKTMLLSGLGIFVVTNLATAVAPTFAIALVTRVLAGIGAAMFAPTATGAAATIVAPERRGFALSVVVAGLSASTALGTPLGAVIGLGDWRWTMVFVSVLGALSAIGVGVLLAHVPLPSPITLAQRIAPIRDPRVALTLLTTLLYQTGHFVAYTYFTVVFDRVLGGGGPLLGALLVLWGVSGTASNLIGGRLSDSAGDAKVILGMLSVLVLAMVALPVAGQHLWSSFALVAVWGACAWGALAPQQHRLVSLAPASAPVVLGLNTSATYLGVTLAGVIGAIALPTVGGHGLGYVAAILTFAGLVVAVATTAMIAAPGFHARFPGSDMPLGGGGAR